MTAADLTDALDAATEAARRGAAELERWRGKFATREKARADLVPAGQRLAANPTP